MLPSTSQRVPWSTSAEANAEIRRQTEANILRVLQGGPEAIDHRLEELDQEWDIERTLEANAATAAMVGTALGALVDRRFFAIPFLVGGFLLQHALQGWCPPLPIFRNLGFRTADEIDHERDTLKALRGDFGHLPEGERRDSGSVRRIMELLRR